MYTAGITTNAACPHQAQILIELLTNADSNELRSRGGFVG
jgi:hypothetical protein